MDIGTIVSVATHATDTAIKRDVGILVLKKALEAESAGAMALIDAITPAANLSPHLGHTIDTTA
jgi:hypothetical protein